METTQVTRRRNLPPVPRPARGREAGPAAPEPEQPEQPARDGAQQFVARLRAAAGDFAAAAGAESAVVPEAVPPARHRRARCRVVLRYADGGDVDLTFLGPTGEPGSPSRHGFDRRIRRWLGAGQLRDPAWVVPDPGSADGEAIDLTAWPAARRAR
jgi:hypothetical protein